MIHFTKLIVSKIIDRDHEAESIFKKLQKRALAAGQQPEPPWSLGTLSALAAAHEALGLGLAYPVV